MKKWKYLFIIMISFIFIIGVLSVNDKNINNEIILNAQTTNDREFKAVWVSPLVSDVSLNGEQIFKDNMTEVLNVMDYYGLNALIFHVRTHNNALYPSDINPKATYVSNIDFNSFDPISWLIEETHKRGIEFHAWMNPYRYNTNYQTGSMPSANPQSNSSNTLEDKILNPALGNVKEHIYATILEFVDRYPTVDSIHFDDYFYVSTSASPTGADARRGHIDELISGIKTRLDSFNSANNTHVQFGISPTGIYKNGNGTVTYDANGLPITTGSKTSGQQHYGDYLYADTLKWMKEGWIDYIIPQVYWARNLSAAPFVDVLSWWDKVARYLDVNLYTGIGLYKSLETGGAGWYTNSDEMNAQYNIIENDMANVLGYAVFSFKHLKMAKDGDTGMVGQQVNNAYNNAKRRAIKVLPEIKSMTPVIPEAVGSTHNNGIITWNSVSDAKFYYIYASSGSLTYSSDEIIGVIGDKPGINSYSINNYNSSYNYGIRALSGTNHLSPISAEPPVEVYNITYDLGEYGYLSEETKHSLLFDFVTDYKEYYGRTASTAQELYDDFVAKSYIPGNIADIFQPEYKDGKWVWLYEYIINKAVETEYNELSKLQAWNQTTWRTNIQGFIEEKEFEYYNANDVLVSTSLDFSTVEAINGFWRYTPYNKVTKLANEELLSGSTVTSWHEDYVFAGWYLNPEFTGELVTAIPENIEVDLNLYAKWNKLENNNVVQMLPGASIRTSGTQGLRFFAKIDESFKNNEHGFYLIHGHIEHHELENLIKNNETTYHEKDIIKVEVSGVMNFNNEYSIVLIGIPKVGYLDNITVIAYLRDGNDIILSSNAVKRSVAEVAIKSYENGEDVKTIIDDIEENLYTVDNEKTTLYELDLENLKETFFNDWNKIFNTNLINPDASLFYISAKDGSVGEASENKDLKEANIYKFFNDPIYQDKWGWFLNYLESVDSTIHTSGQINAIKGNGTYINPDLTANKDSLYNASHLSYSIYNFFNKEHQKGRYTAIDFTDLDRYDHLASYNNKIIKINIILIDYIIISNN